MLTAVNLSQGAIGPKSSVWVAVGGFKVTSGKFRNYGEALRL